MSPTLTERIRTEKAAASTQSIRRATERGHTPRAQCEYSAPQQLPPDKAHAAEWVQLKEAQREEQ